VRPIRKAVETGGPALAIAGQLHRPGGDMRRATISLLGGLWLLLGSGCAMMELAESRDFMGHKAQLTDAQKQYTRLMRWNEFSQASQSIDPEQRSAYLTALRDLGEIRITDYETAAPEFDELVDNATVRVRYTAYRNETLDVVTFSEDQLWKRDAESGDWRLTHDGAPLVLTKDVSAR
jgi:hypothetical protein